MAPQSGFDPLFQALQTRLGQNVKSFFVDNQANSCNIFNRFARKLNRNLNVVSGRPASPDVSPFVRPSHISAARKCVAYLEANLEARLVLSAGENQFASPFLDAPSSIRKRIYICLHQPAAWFRLHWRDLTTLSDLAGVIALSSDQRSFFAHHISAPVVLIRHGVCHTYFSPSPEPRAPSPRFIFVGQWLRDFDTLAQAIPLILSTVPQAHFDLVVPRFARNQPSLFRLAKLDAVSWHSDLSAESLRSLYQQSSALLLPLIDSTANNALLEAMACGLPIIATNVGGAQEYVGEDAGFLCPLGDAEAHAQAAAELALNPQQASEMGQAGRARVERLFRWDDISQELIQVIR